MHRSSPIISCNLYFQFQPALGHTILLIYSTGQQHHHSIRAPSTQKPKFPSAIIIGLRNPFQCSRQHQQQQPTGKPLETSPRRSRAGRPQRQLVLHGRSRVLRRHTQPSLTLLTLTTNDFNTKHIRVQPHNKRAARTQAKPQTLHISSTHTRAPVHFGKDTHLSQQPRCSPHTPRHRHAPRRPPRAPDRTSARARQHTSQHHPRWRPDRVSLQSRTAPHPITHHPHRQRQKHPKNVPFPTENKGTTTHPFTHTQQGAHTPHQPPRDTGFALRTHTHHTRGPTRTPQPTFQFRTHRHRQTQFTHIPN